MTKQKESQAQKVYEFMRATLEWAGPGYWDLLVIDKPTIAQRCGVKKNIVNSFLKQEGYLFLTTDEWVMFRAGEWRYEEALSAIKNPPTKPGGRIDEPDGVSLWKTARSVRSSRVKRHRLRGM